MSKKNIRVLIADDQNLFRDGLVDILEDDVSIKIAGEAVDGEQAIKMTLDIRPDLVLMDIKLPKINGIEATKRIREKNKEVGILVLSTFEDDIHVAEAMSAGANGYLSKMLSAQDLVKAIKTYSERGSTVSGKFLDKFVDGKRTSLEKDSTLFLTDGEIEILAQMGKGKTNADIADITKKSVKTVKNYANSIFQKLGAENRTEAVVKAIERGIISAEKDVFDNDNNKA